MDNLLTLRYLIPAALPSNEITVRVAKVVNLETDSRIMFDKWDITLQQLDQTIILNYQDLIRLGNRLGEDTRGGDVWDGRDSPHTNCWPVSIQNDQPPSFIALNYGSELIGAIKLEYKRIEVAKDLFKSIATLIRIDRQLETKTVCSHYCRTLGKEFTHIIERKH